MKTYKKILDLIKKHEKLSGAQIADILGISRQAVSKHLKNIMLEGLVTKEGVTRGAYYRLSASPRIPPKAFKRTLLIANLEEDRVFQEIALFMNLKKALSVSAYEIAGYAFTELLNNAIDHSVSPKCRVEVELDDFNLYFRIRDFGVGIFFSIYDKFDLADENAAVGELVKGKTTTMAEKHSGEGIFFTSKAADLIFFKSHKIKLVYDNQRSDVFIEEERNMRGTEVFFRISKRSRRKLDSIFSFYAPEEFDFRFKKTRAMVKLFQQEYVSRSEAKRLLHGLEKFREIILDFKDVRKIGQGFADEVFRIFMQSHPDIVITLINLSPVLLPIVKHVVDNKINNRLTIS